MEENKTVYKSIDEYIALYPIDVQEKLQEIREVISESAPDAVEKISWRMPTFYQFGNLVHFAAFKKHIGFFPGADGIATFQDRFSEYKSSKGGVQFPFDKPMPLDLVREIVKFRVNENIRNVLEKNPKKNLEK